MSLRRQPPVYSPLTLRAIAAGVAGGSSAAPQRVERLVRETFGAEAVLLTDSGTSALALAIRAAMKQRPGAAVALPAFACYDLATAADGADARVVLYDLDPATLAPEPGSLRKALAAGVAAVVIVHLYGIPVPLDELTRDVSSAGALVIEDAAQGVGGSLGGRPLGGWGPLSVLSFGRGKGATGGGGGALLGFGAARDAVAASSELGAAASAGRSLVALSGQWLLGRPLLYGLPSALPFLRLGETLYHPPHAPRRPSPALMQALADLWPLREPESAMRRRHATRLLAAAGGALRPVPAPAGSQPGWLRLPFVMQNDARATALAEGRSLGVMPGYPLALCDLEGFQARVVNRADDFAGARMLARRLLTAPTHSLLGESDLVALEGWMARFSA